MSGVYQGPFVMAPDYSRVKTVGLTADVAETYAPLNITVAYAGQVPVPKPFLMILEWVRTPEGWRMATDIALPIPPASLITTRRSPISRNHGTRRPRAWTASMGGARPSISIK